MDNTYKEAGVTQSEVWISSKKEVLEEDFRLFLIAAISSVCNCYDHTQGLYPDECSCETRKDVHDTISRLISYHKEITRKYGFQD